MDPEKERMWERLLLRVVSEQSETVALVHSASRNDERSVAARVVRFHADLVIRIHGTGSGDDGEVQRRAPPGGGYVEMTGCGWVKRLCTDLGDEMELAGVEVYVKTGYEGDGVGRLVEVSGGTDDGEDCITEGGSEDDGEGHPKQGGCATVGCRERRSSTG